MLEGPDLVGPERGEVRQPALLGRLVGQHRCAVLLIVEVTPGSNAIHTGLDCRLRKLQVLLVNTKNME